MILYYLHYNNEVVSVPGASHHVLPVFPLAPVVQHTKVNLELVGAIQPLSREVEERLLVPGALVGGVLHETRSVSPW